MYFNSLIVKIVVSNARGERPRDRDTTWCMQLLAVAGRPVDSDTLFGVSAKRMRLGDQARE